MLLSGPPRFRSAVADSAFGGVEQRSGDLDQPDQLHRPFFRFRTLGFELLRRQFVILGGVVSAALGIGARGVEEETFENPFGVAEVEVKSPISRIVGWVTITPTTKCGGTGTTTSSLDSCESVRSCLYGIVVLVLKTLKR